MGNTVLRNIIANIKSCEPCWYSIIADETMDVTCKEQMIRYVNDDYVVNEDSLGVHCIPYTKADTLLFLKMSLIVVGYLCHFVGVKLMMVHQQCKADERV